MAPLLRAVYIALGCLWFGGAAKAAQDQEHYERAISDISTSPYYVLVTIINDNTGSTFNGCVSANLLQGAIFVEIGGHFGQAGDDRQKRETSTLLAKARDIALRNTKHEFHFSNHAAISNIPIEYTEDDLEDARRALKSIGMKPLMSKVSPERRSLGRLEWSAALACAIVEQGASARRADITSQIYAEP